MSITFTCPACESEIRVKDSFAGKRGKCPSCQQSVTVPQANAAAEFPEYDELPTEDVGRRSLPPVKKSIRRKRESVARAMAPKRKLAGKRAKDVREQVLSSFGGAIEPVRTSVFYRCGVLLAALFVILLPLLYLGVVVLAGYGVYWHATENVGITSMGYGRGRILAVMLYLAPLIAGSVTVLFMLKPLLARPSRDQWEVSLNRGKQLLLFEFVDRICETVNAPRPSKINVSFDVNASASYGSGILSLFKSDMVLTVGLPLVAGMTLQQFAGVLAHEFGHFSQGTAMRVSWIVRNINHWFARVVYQRDEWDDFLTEASEETDFRIGWIFFLARAAVFVSRGVLWCFMMLSTIVSCWLLRQMEYDADQYETRLVGSEQFGKTCLRLHYLMVGLSSYVQQQMLGQGNASCGNPVRDAVACADTIDEKTARRIRKAVQQGKTGWFDSHPADAERIAHAEKLAASGVFKSDLPAEAVFRNFDLLCGNMMNV